MKYTLNFFTHNDTNEQFIASYDFNEMPFVPRKKDLISFGTDQYIVRRVATSYDDIEDNKMLVEIMLDRADCDKEWWE